MSTERTYGGLTAAQLSALDKAATPGPWFEQYEYDGARTVCQMRSCDTTFCVNRAAHVEGNPYEQTKENGRLVSAARNALPEMLAHIAELEAQLAEARKDTARLDAIIEWSNNGNGWLTDDVWDQASELCPVDAAEADNTNKWIRAAIDAEMEGK